MLLSDLFERDVTRTIPPVVYFHEQEPIELQREVDEYIITGGYPKEDDRATTDGIHEQFVRLLNGMAAELAKTQVELPACWISGYYGSGKSSFAKLLGLALDGLTLPGGRSLAEALVSQDHSPNKAKLREAWALLQQRIEEKPIAVVFDVGSKARDDEHIHSVIVRQVQHRLGYSRTSNLVAEYELKLELEGLYEDFAEKAAEVCGKPWGALKDSHLVEDEFSRVMSVLRPELFPDTMSWVDARAGSVFESRRSADEAVEAIERMMRKRSPGQTLFVVVDEVSQYVHEDTERMLALQSFVSALGQRMKGKAWLLATGQQKLEEGAGPIGSIAKLKDRFPMPLRVHLGTGNIRDVVHKRLLRKKAVVEGELKALFHEHRTSLALYAYKGEGISETDFVEIYPLLPKQVDLLMDITTGLRSRSVRSQGDAYAIRGLLQLLGDLFREKGLAQREVGYLIPIDLVYEVLHSGLGPDVQLTLSRALEHGAKAGDPLLGRVVKAVSMLEMVQDERDKKTSAELVARCLYDRLGQGNLQPQVQKALDTLVGHGFVTLSEKTGYKIESAAGQEWQRERDGYVPTSEQISEQVREKLKNLVGDVDIPKIDQLSFPWLAFYSDTYGARDLRLKDERKHTVVTVDFQFTRGETAEHWIPKSATEAYRDRIVWVVGDARDVRAVATKLLQASRMVEKHAGGESSMHDDKKRLLIDERNRLLPLASELTEALKAAFMAGSLFFQGKERSPADLGPTFLKALSAYGATVVRTLYPNPLTFSIAERDILFLIENRELSAPPAVLGADKLGILSQDGGRWEATCHGRLPSDILALVRDRGAVEGGTLVAHFGVPPHGVAPDLVRAAVVGLLRGSKIRIEIPGVGHLTSVQDQGARELLKEGGLRKAEISLNEHDPLTGRDRNAICALLKETLGDDVARDNDAIADAVTKRFSLVRDRLNQIGERFRRLPQVAYPETLSKLETALEKCRRDRKVEPTLVAVKSSLGPLRDGLTMLRRVETDLTEPTIALLRDAATVLQHQASSLEAIASSDEARADAATLRAQLASPRPWENASAIEPAIARLRAEYQSRRRAILEAHAQRLELHLRELKLRDGFDRLDAPQRDQVLRPLQNGGAATTDDKAIAPPLEVLAPLLRDRLESAYDKALLELGSVLEAAGGAPTVELSLDFRGREIKSEAELERFLDELRRRVLHELSANHRVRLK